jgi:hypothetical protein
MKKLTWLVGLLGLAACSTPPALQPSRDLGSVQLPFGDAVQTQAAIPDSQLSFVALGAAQVQDDAAYNVRFIRRSFRIQNGSSGVWTNLIFHAYNQNANNAQGTALKNIQNFGGQPVLNPQQAIPKHGMTGSGTLTVDSSAADLQLFDEITTAAAQTEAGLPANDYLLAYGFLVQQRSGDTDSDSNPRTIAAGETGTVTLSYTIPKDASSAYSFVATFRARTSSDVDVVQSEEELLADTTAGLTTLQNVRRVTVPGGQACGTPSGTGVSLKFINQLRMAGKVGGTGTDTPVYAFNTPSIGTTVNSSSDSGAGSLREAIANASAGASLCFTQSVTLASQLVLDKNLTIHGGNTVFLSGNNATRVLEVQSSRTVGLFGFEIRNGRTQVGPGSGGAAVLNAGTLVLKGMQLKNNSARGASMMIGLNSAQGGAIYNTGTLQLFYSNLSSNNATAEAGMSQFVPSLPGDPGGTAQGGAIYNTGTLNLASSTVGGNSAFGGAGSNGGMGMTQVIFMPPPSPPMENCVIPAGSGGTGGNAAGGGIYSTVAFTNNASVSGNSATAGAGGSAGGPSPCSTAQASSGTATGQNTVP